MGILIYWIKSNLHQKITVEDLAKKTGVSIPTIHRNFKELTGVTPNHFIWNLKLIEAKKVLLANPKVNIKEIGKMIGINNSSYFSKIFKKYIGQTPEEFRK